jgi:hypothetical protein
VSAPEPTAILVVLKPGTTDVEAATVRTAMRMWSHVAEVRPLSKDNRQAVADARARSLIADELTPIFEKLRGEVMEKLEATTGELEAVIAVEPAPSSVTTLPEPRQPSSTPGRPTPTPRQTQSG